MDVVIIILVLNVINFTGLDLVVIVESIQYSSAFLGYLYQLNSLKFYLQIRDLFQGEKAICIFDYANQFLKPWDLRWMDVMQVTCWHFFVALILV